MTTLSLPTIYVCRGSKPVERIHLRMRRYGRQRCMSCTMRDLITVFGAGLPQPGCCIGDYRDSFRRSEMLGPLPHECIGGAGHQIGQDATSFEPNLRACVAD